MDIGPGPARRHVGRRSDQPGAAIQVIDHHSPVVHPYGHVGQVDIANGDGGKTLEAAAKVVGEIPEGAPAERQSVNPRRPRTQALTQQVQGITVAQLQLAALTYCRGCATMMS